jgi:hypothetical protein
MDLPVNTIIKRGFNILILFLLILYIAIPFQNTTIMSFVYQGIVYINTLLFLICLLFGKQNSVKGVDLLLIFFSIFSLFISILISKTTVNLLQVLPIILNYLGMFFMVFYIDYIRIDYKLINLIFIINILISILFIFLSLSPFAYSRILTDYNGLTLGFNNPNQTAMYLFLNLIVLIAAFNFYKNGIISIFLAGLSLYIGYLIYLTDSRACLLSTLLILIMNVRNKKLKLNKFLILLIILFPFLFLFLYTYFYKNGYFLDLLILNKPIYSGRETFFTIMLNNVKSSLLFGDFIEYKLANLHNGSLSILLSLGLVGLAFYYSFFIRNLFRVLNNKFNNRTAFIAFCGILTIYIQASAEASLMVSGSVNSIAIGLLFLLTKIDLEELYNERNS